MPGIKVPLPMVPGCDAAGRVDAVGEGVSGWSPGGRVLVDPVFTDTETGRFWMIGDTRWGAYAAFVVVEQTQLLALPDEMSAVDASCLPVAYGSSHRMMITRGKIQPGEKVLILGASGGVGTSALLLVKFAASAPTWWWRPVLKLNVLGCGPWEPMIVSTTPWRILPRTPGVAPAACSTGAATTWW